MQTFTLRPLDWVEAKALNGHTKHVTDTIKGKLVIAKSLFDGSYDIDLHTECNSWTLHFGVESLEKAKSIAFEEHCKQLRKFII